MKTKKILAFDFGASSGRTMIAELIDGKLTITEIHRFPNEPVNICGRLYWDILRLFHEIKQGIILANQKGGFDSIGIDTWGVDFGLIDENGELLENPVHYRDARTKDIPSEVFEIISQNELYSKTGTQLRSFNTICQLYHFSKYRRDTLNCAKTFLMIPDLFAYFLTGEKRLEYTNASTTNLLNPNTKTIDNEILKKLNIPQSIFPEMIMPGESYGNLSKEICDELHCESVPVFAVATHDTASAVASVPTNEKDYAYISCGTWSILGTVVDEPLITEESERIGFTNEGASDGKIRYLKNITGLWLIQQSRSEWKRQGLNVSFDEMEKQAVAAPAFSCFINPDDDLFTPPGDMPSRVIEYCKMTNQHVPSSMGEILRCIYESLAFKYKYAISSLESLTDKKFGCLHMVGGGIKDELLCRMTADACAIPVVSGPVEATVTGNVVLQLMAFGDVKNLSDARDIIKSGTVIKEYAPNNSAEWDKNYNRFLEVTKL